MAEPTVVLTSAVVENGALVWNGEITTSDGFTYRHGRGYRVTVESREQPDDPESPLTAAALALAAGDHDGALRADVKRVMSELEARVAVAKEETNTSSPAVSALVTGTAYTAADL